MQVDMCSFTRVHGLAGVNSRSLAFESEHRCNTYIQKGFRSPEPERANRRSEERKKYGMAPLALGNA